MLVLLPLALAATLAQGAQIPLNHQDGRDGKIIDEALFSFIQDELDDGNIVGMSMAIVLAGGEVEYETWGNRTEDGEPVTPDTLFNLASCSKAFLSASLGILMQDFVDGKNLTALPGGITEFSWNTKVQDLLPDEWMLEDEWATKKANVKDLLAHVTGLPSHDGSYSPYDSPADLLARMKYLRAAYELREQYEYTNQMYITGAHIVSKYSGLSYRDFVEERIMKPLGMNSSTLYPDRAFATGRMTQSWSEVNGRRVPFYMPEHSAELMAGAAGVMSTVEDMTAWVKMLLNGGVDASTNATIIPRETVELATSAISLSTRTGTGLLSISAYGLGWGRYTYRGHELAWHNGGAPGVATMVHLYPLDGAALVLLANTATRFTTKTITRTIVDRIFGLPKYDHRQVAAGAATTAIADTNPPSSDQQLDPWPPIPEIPLMELAGNYTNAGYGNFTLCSPLFSVSPECRATLDDFRTVDSASDSDKFPVHFLELQATWLRFWGTYLRFSPVPDSDELEYDVVMTYLFPNGYGADVSPFENPVGERYTAKFVANDDGEVIGLGLFGVAKEAETWRARKGDSVQETADVWFDKI